MEKRGAEKRRQVHMFVADERREGPYDRRNDDIRRLERERERKKIEKIRVYRAKDHTTPTAEPLLTKKRLVYLALLAIIAAVLLLLL